MQITKLPSETNHMLFSPDTRSFTLHQTQIYIVNTNKLFL